MDNLGEKIRAMLSDPKTMQTVMDLAGSLGQTAPPPRTQSDVQTEGTSDEKNEPIAQETKQETQNSSVFFPALQNLLHKGKGERNAVLHAIRPYLEQRKQTKVDQAIKAVQSAEMILQMKELF